MEKQIKFSFKDKFLSTDKEQKINRIQFFLRILLFYLPNILLYYFLFFVFYFYQNIIYWFFIIASNDIAVNVIKVISILYIVAILKIIPILIKKRCHDFNRNWIFEVGIFYTMYTISLLPIIALFFPKTFTEFGSLYGVLLYLSKISSVIIMLLYLYLIIRPWIKQVISSLQNDNTIQ